MPAIKNSNVKFINQFEANWTVDGHKVIGFSYDLGKQYHYTEIYDWISEKVMKFPNYDKLMFGVNVYAPKQLKNDWLFGGWCTYDDITIVGSVVLDSFGTEPLEIRHLQLYVYDTRKNKKKKVGRDDEKNDCLFYSIFKSVNYDKKLLPQGIRKPSSFKKFLGYERKDKITLSKKLFKKLEDKLNCSFTISGDYSYISDTMKHRNICLKVSEEHITLMCNEKRNRTHLRFNEVEKSNVLSYYFCQQAIYIYDGEHQTKISEKKFKDLSTSFDYLLIKSKSKEKLFETRTAYIRRADILYKATNGRINFYKCQYDPVMAFEIFRQSTKSIPEPEELDLDNNEAIIIDKAFRGGLQYRNDGQEYDNVFDYDMNRMYSNYMKSNYFKFPVARPEFKHLKNDEFQEMKYYPIGIYYVIIQKEHMFVNLPINTPIWITNYDVSIAKLCGIKPKLIDDDDCINSLVYGMKKCILGSYCFKTYTEYFGNLRDEGYDVKGIETSLWGYMAQKNKIIKRIRKDETYDVVDANIEEIIPYENATMITTVHKTDIFNRPWCRIAPFLTSYCRLKMVEILMKLDTEKIIYVNTDGFTYTEKVEHLRTSSEIGDWKFTRYNKCKTENGTIKFRCEYCKNYYTNGVLKNHKC